MTDAIVVGAGIFGQAIAAELRDQGRVVRVLDSRWIQSGSRPSACLMKPSWFAGLRKEDRQLALATLDRLYGVESIKFRLAPSPVRAEVLWVDPAKILAPDVDWCLVSKIEPARRGALVKARWHEGVEFEEQAPLVVVAAGSLTNELLPDLDVEVKAKAGASFIWPESSIAEPLIRPWAPYKQVVAFNLPGDFVWCGDGTALKPESLTLERLYQSAQRCSAAVDLPRESCQTLIGHRPYVDKQHLNGEPCLLRELSPGLWVATGGAKNGTIAAGWAAAMVGMRG